MDRAQKTNELGPEAAAATTCVARARLNRSLPSPPLVRELEGRKSWKKTSMDEVRFGYVHGLMARENAAGAARQTGKMLFSLSVGMTGIEV